MDFGKLMNVASNNQLSAVNKVKSKKSKDGSSQVSSSAVKAFLDRQKSEKAKQKEQEEAARRARIQARLQGKQLDKSKCKKSPEDVSNEEKKKKSVKNQNAPRPEDAATSCSKHRLKHKEKADNERKIAKSKEKEKKLPEEKSNRVEENKPVAKVKKPARPTMSFQELMNVAKQQADNPDAFRNVTAVQEPKMGSTKTIKEKSSPNDRSVKNGREKEIKYPERNNEVAGKNSREKNNTTSQKKQSIETRERKLPETRDRKQPECRERKQSEIRDRKLPANRDRKIPETQNRQKPRNLEGDVKRKVSEKPRMMTIERETISQKEYGSQMKHRGSNFQRKRRHNPYDDDDDDEDMDEFIDDSGETPDTVSSYIKEIFGYDRNKFRDRDEDIGSMESSYADIQREEAKSLRIAKLEDEVENLKESYELQRQGRKTKKLKH